MANSSSPRHALVICGLLAACGKPAEVRVLDLADFPQQVGPPFGIDALAGGMSDREVSLVLERINGSEHRIDYSLQNENLGFMGRAGHRIGYSLKNEKLRVVGRLEFDGERLGDVVFTFKNCEAVRSIMISRWGAPSEESFRMTKQLLWQSARSRWFASMEVGLSACSVAFTSSDFFGPNVTAFAQFSQLKPGMSRAAATQISSEVATAGMAIGIRAVFDGLQGVDYHQTDRIEQVFSILPPRAIAALRRAWGNGAMISGEPRMVWFDGGTGDRATLEGNRVAFDKAVRWEDWLGDGPSIKALGSPILGRSVADLKKERGADLSVEAPDKWDISHHPTVELRLRPSQWSPDSRTRVDLQNDGATVTHLTVILDFDTPATRAAMIHAFETKWGASKPGSPGLVFHADHMTVQVAELDSGFQVSMENDP